MLNHSSIAITKKDAVTKRGTSFDDSKKKLRNRVNRGYGFCQKNKVPTLHHTNSPTLKPKTKSLSLQNGITTNLSKTADSGYESNAEIYI